MSQRDGFDDLITNPPKGCEVRDLNTGRLVAKGEPVSQREELNPLEAEKPGQVNCLECGKPIPYTVGTCPHCGRKEF